jgi:hypothetical protein
MITAYLAISSLIMALVAASNVLRSNSRDADTARWALKRHKAQP